VFKTKKKHNDQSNILKQSSIWSKSLFSLLLVPYIKNKKESHRILIRIEKVIS
jgi:hypothetical protein